MSINYFAFAVPLFLFFIGLEYYVARRQGKSYFKFDSSVANLNVGIAERLIDLFAAGGFYFFYDYLHQHYALFDIRPSVLLWITLLLLTDFLWYWYHRLGHEVNLLWGFHIVHHQSEEFNYTAATRITIFQAVVRTLFWSVLPLLGFPPEMISVTLIIHGVYPFFTHTQLIGKLGVLEYILVTPSHHRVHHACNERYLDKNYGDMLIIWDKLFGTFQAEDEPAVYGITNPMKNYSFLWQHFHYLIEIFYACRNEPSWSQRVKILLGKPTEVSAHWRTVAERRFLSQRQVQPATKRFRLYVVIQMIVVLAGLFFTLLFEQHLPLYTQCLIAFVILITLVNCGAILDQRQWIFYLEYLRVALFALLVFVWYPSQLTAVVVGGVLICLACYFTQAERQYLTLVYG